MIFINPIFNILAETAGKVHHLMSFLFGHHTGMIITADIPFLSKLIQQINQADIGLDRIHKRLVQLRDVGKNISFYSSAKSGIRDFRAERAKLKRCVIGVIDYRGP